jgi:hypothetical protein
VVGRVKPGRPFRVRSKRDKRFNRMMIRHWLISALQFWASANLALAQTGGDEIRLRAGFDAQVGLYADLRPDCTSGPLPTIRLVVAPAHGAVAVKRATLKASNLSQCLATETPALVVIYHSAKDYNGPDEFTLEIGWRRGHKQLRRVWLRVLPIEGTSNGI